ncbi:putative ABC transporter permease [Blautia marasmi]|uniref:putative ABC transporter permease n=1 Tax=Blautia marasmi TaxID=1917868 RepID=UPI000CF1E5AE|nr:putative ABC transporter permease [Blautia marasmi]
MNYTLYQLLWFFLLYSFIGWTIGTSVAAVREHRFIDVGFLFGPYCPAYGFGAVAFAVFLPELRNHLFFLFLGGVILSSVITFSTGFVLEKIFHRKWWDYSRKRFQFGGYVNLPYTIVWGLSAVICISFINPSLKELLALIPSNLGTIILIILYVVLCLDLAGTVMAIKAVHSRLRKLSIIEDVSENLQKAADMMGEGLTGWVQKHMAKAYPSLEAKELLAARQEKERQMEAARERAGVFAVGCSFYKLVCLFFLGAFLGDITETVFCLATTGKLMSRSSVVYGPFSIVWGLGCVLLTAILYQYRSRSDSYIFIFGTILGGAYEYICSVFTELVFGTVFWDYSNIPFNLGGRINLLYCFFWGIAAVIWLKCLYPLLSSLIEKIPKRAGIPITWLMILFMIFNMIMSGLALNRYTERHSNKSDNDNAVTRFLDKNFTDERMEQIYPNAILVED